MNHAVLKAIVFAGLFATQVNIISAQASSLSTNADWTWMKGANITNQLGTYGTQGVADPANMPGARDGAVSWTDADGALWLFGGKGYAASGGQGYLNDLWKYDPVTTYWIWMKGAIVTNQHGTYGTIGVAGPANTPGARQYTVSWIDAAGALWLFGGEGYDASGVGGLGYRLNDLWKYDPTTTNWTWMKGANSNNQSGTYGTQGSANPANTPGARLGMVSWIDAAGALWLFGGYGYLASEDQGYLNDLWKFNPVTTNWTWIKGANIGDQPGTYGIQGTADPANTPGARFSAVSWMDAAGALWLFGGYNSVGMSLRRFNDLWKYDPVTTNWTWMKGANITNQPGTYGTQGVADMANTPGARSSAVSWTDATGALWLFGGGGYDASGDSSLLNDLWKYDPATTCWTWIKGTNIINQHGTYGTQGVADPANTPGARQYTVSWIDAAGVLWLFGGDGYDASGDMGHLNDLWKYAPTDNHPINPINDYDGDGKSDMAVYQDGLWYIYSFAKSSTLLYGGRWGGPDSTPISGDYDGDGKADMTVYQNGLWYIYSFAKSSTLLYAGRWGGPDSTPMSGDYDGDGKSDLAVYQDGLWYIYSFAKSSTLLYAGRWGGSDSTPISGDYDGDGKSDMAVYQDGLWYIYSFAKSSTLLYAGRWGGPDSIPISGDYDGDGKSDLTVYQDGLWYIYSFAKSSTLLYGGRWGGPDSIPVQ